MIRIDVGSEVHGHFAEEGTAEIGNEGLLGNFVAETGVLEILDDADDLHVGRRARIGAETQVKADGISSGEILFGKLLVDHYGRGRPVPRLGTVLYLMVVVDGEVPPSDNRHPQCGKIIRANLVHIGLGMLIRLRRSEALDGHAAVPFVGFKNAHGSQPDRLNAGNRAESFRQLRIENIQALRSVAVKRRVDLEAHKLLRGKTGAQIAQVRETANK